MTNPLARVVMNTVIQKTNENTSKTYKKERNLTSKDEDLISRLIKGEKGVEEKNIKSTPITLEEAAEQIRNKK